MKIIETNWYKNGMDEDILQVRYEQDGKVNRTPMYVIRNNELVKLSEA